MWQTFLKQTLRFVVESLKTYSFYNGFQEMAWVDTEVGICQNGHIHVFDKIQTVYYKLITRAHGVQFTPNFAEEVVSKLQFPTP